MKRLKYLYLISFLATTLFYSCGNESDEIIRYTESKIDTCFIYVGSETGGVELHSDSIKDRLDLIFPETTFENFNNTTFSFIDETTVLIEQESAPEINNYIFQGNSLYLYKNNEPIYFGDGDITSFNIRQHYIAYKQAGDNKFTTLQVPPQKELSKEDAAKQSPFVTIQNMKSIEDTLIWCTRSSLFR